MRALQYQALTVVMIPNFPEPERFTLNCPTQQILDVISNKWTVIVLYCLAYQPRRYSELQHRIEGISQKILTQTLRKLERHGLIQRQVLSEMPANVEYSLTPLGETIIEPLLAIGDWARSNFEAVETARTTYDQLQLRS